MGVNHVHAHDDEEGRASAEEVARDRADRFAVALEAVVRAHAQALRLADQAEREGR